MTCIVGMVEKESGKVFIGGDSRGANGWLQYSEFNNKKVFKKDDIIFGYTSTFRFGQLVEYKMGYPSRVVGQSTMEYLIGAWIPSLVRCLTDNGHIGKGEKDDGRVTSGVALIGMDGKLFYLNEDFSVLEPSNGLHAVGCGEAYAMGALTVLNDMKLTPEQKVTKAIEVSMTMSAGVGGPVTVVSV